MGAWLAGIGLLLTGAGMGRNSAWAAVVGLAVLLPFDAPLGFGALTIYTNEIYLAGVALGWAWRWSRGSRELRSAWRALWPLLPFFLILAASTLATGNYAAGGKQTLRWAEFALVFLLAQDALASRGQERRLWLWLCGVGAAVSLAGIVQVLLGDRMAANLQHGLQGLETMQGYTAIRAYATFGHPNQFAGYLILLLPLSIAMWWEQRTRLSQAGWGTAGLLLGSALLLTYSRGGWLGAGLALGLLLGYFFLRQPRKAAVLLVLLLLCGAGLAAGAPKLQTRLASLGTLAQDHAVTGRLHYQKIALRMIMERPWLGQGPGNYEPVRKYYADQGLIDDTYTRSHIHNLYAQIAIETGFLGLAAFLFFLGHTLWRLLAGIRKVPEADRTLAIAFLGSALAFLLHNNFDVLTIYARGTHFALILGLGLAYAALARGENTGN
jgi:putative inorganic carbon (hco3(-)) transporter